jgi:hypothetical protein
VSLPNRLFAWLGQRWPLCRGSISSQDIPDAYFDKSPVNFSLSRASIFRDLAEVDCIRMSAVKFIVFVIWRHLARLSARAEILPLLLPCFLCFSHLLIFHPLAFTFLCIFPLLLFLPLLFFIIFLFYFLVKYRWTVLGGQEWEVGPTLVRRATDCGALGPSCRPLVLFPVLSLVASCLELRRTPLPPSCLMLKSSL